METHHKVAPKNTPKITTKIPAIFSIDEIEIPMMVKIAKKENKLAGLVSVKKKLEK